MRRAISFVTVAAAACSGKSEPVTQRPVVPAVADAAPPDAAVDATPDAAVDPIAAARRERAEAALQRIPELQKALVALRGLPFKHDVVAEYLELDEFEASVTKEMDEEFPPVEVEAMGKALFHLGFLPEPIDLRKAVLDAYTSQVVAYYDYKKDRYALVKVAGDAASIDIITIHELVHALQDQYRDLGKYLDPEPELDHDADAARRFVIEGEATIAMTAHMLSPGDADALDKSKRGALEFQLRAGARMDFDTLKWAAKAQAKVGIADVDADIERQIAAFDTIPPIVMLPLLEAYTKGPVAVFVAFERGGWAEVEKLFASPPESTEQVLHPETKLYPKRDLPTKVTLPAMADHAMVYSNVIGELGWRIYFEQWKKPLATTAAAGWDGDRYAVMTRPDGQQIAFVATTWDTKRDATQFEKAYRATLAARFADDGWKKRIAIVRRGKDVFLVDGPDAAAAAAKFAVDTTFAR
jgi:hypothetical protein